LARISDRSEGTDSPPRQELNPLLNPLLAENMGRWAEVYFTNPPERRDEAVLELLRDLEREETRATPKAPSTAARTVSATKSSGAGQALPEQRQPDMRSCASCGHENPVTHQFCGMCGARVDRDLPEEAARAEEETSRENAEPVNGQAGRLSAMPFAEIESNHSDRDHVPSDRIAEVDEESYAEAERERPEPVFNSPAAGNDSLSLFQSFRAARSEDEDWDYEPTQSNSSRFYIAAVLIIIIGGLGYMAWRGSQNTASSHGASPPPPAPVTETAPENPAPSPTARNPEPTAPPKNAAPIAAPEASRANRAASRNTEASKAQTAKRTSAPPANETPQPKNSLAASGVAGGVEELATAERYLSGTGGRTRDSSEAAQWLWKSVAKHNGQAILLLADLYLRGDGVSKNCDQGRVLLDSAAQKGVAGAGERLRNLQAFGCH